MSQREYWEIRRTHDIGIGLISWAGGAHCVRLAGARLAVCKDGDIVTLYKRVDAVRDILEDALLINLLIEYTVKDKDLFAARGVDCQT